MDVRNCDTSLSPLTYDGIAVGDQVGLRLNRQRMWVVTP